MHIPLANEYCDTIEPARLDTCCWTVRDRFVEDPRLESVPVVGEDGAVLAVLYRHGFIDLMSRQFGHALFAKRNVDRLQNLPVFNTDLMICHGQDPVPVVADRLQQAVAEHGEATAIVMEADTYRGILSNAAILRAMLDLSQAQQASTRQLMDNLTLGVLSIDSEGRIDPVFSKSVVRILGTEHLAACDLATVLRLDPHRHQQLADFLEMMRLDLLPLGDLLPLNPLTGFDYIRENGNRHLAIDFRPLAEGSSGGGRLLVIISDITTEHALAQEVQRQEHENQQLRAIAEDPDLFRDFISETRQILADVGPLINELGANPDREQSRMLIDRIFRGVHTIKGGSASIKLGEIAETAGCMEEALSPLREHPDEADNEELLPVLQNGLKQLGDALGRIRAIAARLLGDVDDDEVYLHLPLSRVEGLVQHAQRAVADLGADASDCCEDMINRIASLRHLPARKALARALKLVPGVAERLGKQVDFRVIGEDVGVDCRFAAPLTAAMVHLLRNALDHGIEDPDDRLAVGKPVTGRLSVTISHVEEHLAVIIADDGRGIDCARILARGRELGLVRADATAEAEALEVLFAPGFTTAGQVTDVSGRGVGLDAVREAICTELGGKIEIDNQPGKGCRFSLIVAQAQYAVTLR